MVCVWNPVIGGKTAKSRCDVNYLLTIEVACFSHTRKSTFMGRATYQFENYFNDNSFLNSLLHAILTDPHASQHLATISRGEKVEIHQIAILFYTLKIVVENGDE